MSRSSRRSPPTDRAQDAPSANGARRGSLALLWHGQLVSALGDAVFRIALGFWLLETTGSRALTAGIIAASTLPRILLSPLAGATADRMARKWILVLADLLCGAAALSIGLAALQGVLELWMVMVATVAIGAGSAFFNPALEAALPDLVSRESVSRINAAFALASTGAALVGNSIGGFAYAAAGASLLFVFNGLSFLLCAILELPLRLPQPPRAPSSTPGLVEQLRLGAATVRDSTGLSWLLAVSLLESVLSSGLFFLLMAHCQAHPHLGPQGYGLMMGGLSAGAICGYLATTLIAVPKRARFSVLCASGIAAGIALGALHIPASTFVLIPIAAVAGFGISLGSTLTTTALQLRAPDSRRGTVLGLRFALMTAASPLGISIAGVLSQDENAGIGVALAGAGIALAHVALWVASPGRKDLDL